MIQHYINLLSIVFGSAALAIMFAELSGIPDVIKQLILPFWHTKTIDKRKLPRRIKPFDCSLCLSFWICLYLSIVKVGMTWEPAIVLSCVSSITSVGIMRVIRKDTI